jgi:hypothetical protein
VDHETNRDLVNSLETVSASQYQRLDDFYYVRIISRGADISQPTKTISHKHQQCANTMRLRFIEYDNYEAEVRMERVRLMIILR